MSESPPRINVVIVNFNSGDRLARCLACLEKQTMEAFTVTIVDNASADESAAVAATTSLTCRLIESRENLGFAAANNLAVKSADMLRSNVEWVAFLNPDAYPEPDWLEQLLSAARGHPDVDAFGSLQLDAADNAVVDGAGDMVSVYGVAYRGHFGGRRTDAPPTGECFAPCAAAAMYRREAFIALGGFDERFFCYGEDVDLGFRLRRAGGRALQVQEAVVRHEGSGVTGRHSDFTVYHGHRNRIWLTYKNLSPNLYRRTAPLRWLADLALALKAAAGGYLPAYLRALRDGYGGRGQFAAERPKPASDPGLNDAVGKLVWSPFAVVRRRGRTWPLEPRLSTPEP